MTRLEELFANAAKPRTQFAERDYLPQSVMHQLEMDALRQSAALRGVGGIASQAEVLPAAFALNRALAGERPDDRALAAFAAMGALTDAAAAPEALPKAEPVTRSQGRVARTGPRVKYRGRALPGALRWWAEMAANPETDLERLARSATGADRIEQFKEAAAVKRGLPNDQPTFFAEWNETPPKAADFLRNADLIAHLGDVGNTRVQFERGKIRGTHRQAEQPLGTTTTRVNPTIGLLAAALKPRSDSAQLAKLLGPEHTMLTTLIHELAHASRIRKRKTRIEPYRALRHMDDSGFRRSSPFDGLRTVSTGDAEGADLFPDAFNRVPYAWQGHEQSARRSEVGLVPYEVPGLATWFADSRGEPLPFREQWQPNYAGRYPPLLDERGSRIREAMLGGRVTVPAFNKTRPLINTFQTAGLPKDPLDALTLLREGVASGETQFGPPLPGEVDYFGVGGPAWLRGDRPFFSYDNSREQDVLSIEARDALRRRMNRITRLRSLPGAFAPNDPGKY